MNSIVLELRPIDTAPNVMHLVVQGLGDAAAEREQYDQQHSQLDPARVKAVPCPVVLVLTPDERVDCQEYVLDQEYEEDE